MTNIPEDILPRSMKTSLPVPTVVSSVLGVAQSVEKDQVRRFLSTG